MSSGYTFNNKGRLYGHSYDEPFHGEEPLQNFVGSVTLNDRIMYDRWRIVRTVNSECMLISHNLVTDLFLIEGEGSPYQKSAQSCLERAWKDPTWLAVWEDCLPDHDAPYSPESTGALDMLRAAHPAEMILRIDGLLDDSSKDCVSDPLGRAELFDYIDRTYGTNIFSKFNGVEFMLGNTDETERWNEKPNELDEESINGLFAFVSEFDSKYRSIFAHPYSQSFWIETAKDLELFSSTERCDLFNFLSIPAYNYSGPWANYYNTQDYVYRQTNHALTHQYPDAVVGLDKILYHTAEVCPNMEMNVNFAMFGRIANSYYPRFYQPLLNIRSRIGVGLHGDVPQHHNIMTWRTYYGLFNNDDTSKHFIHKEQGSSVFEVSRDRASDIMSVPAKNIFTDLLLDRKLWVSGISFITLAAKIEFIRQNFSTASFTLGNIYYDSNNLTMLGTFREIIEKGALSVIGACNTELADPKMTVVTGQVVTGQNGYNLSNILNPYLSTASSIVNDEVLHNMRPPGLEFSPCREIVP